MQYISTRGKAPVRNFRQVLLEGLATDGGLYVPATLPYFRREEMLSWRELSYAELAERILLPFVGDSLSAQEFTDILQRSWASFRVADTVALRPLADREWVLELFHGPTFSFKDCAMQLLGRLLNTVLEKEGVQGVVLGATSGDTGSAAIAACKEFAHLHTVILHPHGRTSEIQRLQMTTETATNVHNLALEGDFDDCQAIVKQCFSNQDFLPSDCQLVAVNSINWARIMAQTVYYFWTWLQLDAPEKGLLFSVPTGNFGDIYSGYLAANMGLPVDHLVAGVGENDILERFFREGRYSLCKVHPTLAPSIDISVPSNFERLLFDWCDRDSVQLTAWMQHFRERGDLEPGAPARAGLRELFHSARIDDAEICETIARVYREHEYLIDPHSAVGIAAGRRCVREMGSAAQSERVFLATAHPCKFSDAMQRALGFVPTPPESIAQLYRKKENYRQLPATLDAVSAYIAGFLSEHAPLAEGAD